MIIPSRFHSKMQIAWREAEFFQSNSITFTEASDTDTAGKLNKAMVDMFITIFIEPLPTAYPFNHSLLIYFACLMGLDLKTGQYRTARRHTPYLAPLLWIIRLIILIHLNPIDTSNHEFQTEHWEQSAGSPSPTRGHDYTQQSITNPILDQFMAFRNKYLRIGQNYPFSELISAFIYARVIGSNENAPPTCEWNMELDTVIILKQIITMGQLHQFTQDAIITVEKVFRTVMFGFEPFINFENIRDRMNNLSPGFSFLSDPGNEFEHKYIDFF